jgi:hypothetical protein
MIGYSTYILLIIIIWTFIELVFKGAIYGILEDSYSKRRAKELTAKKTCDTIKETKLKKE